MMIKTHIFSPNPVVRPRQGRLVALCGTLSVLMAILSLPAPAEDVANENPAIAVAEPAPAVLDLSAMSPAEIQEALVDARSEFVQIRKSLQECRNQAEESERGRELLGEMAALRKELALVEAPAAQATEQTDEQASESGAPIAPATLREGIGATGPAGPIRRISQTERPGKRIERTAEGDSRGASRRIRRRKPRSDEVECVLTIQDFDRGRRKIGNSQPPMCRLCSRRIK